MLKLAGFAALHEPAAETPADHRALLARLSGQDVRRISRYTAFAMAGAHLCRQSAGSLRADSALYLCSEQANLGDTGRVVHGITIERRPPTPFDFLAVSSNIAGFHVARQLGLEGPNLTLARSDAGLEAGLELALLNARRNGRASLIGYVEDCAWPLAQHRRRVSWPEGQALAECSHWLYLDPTCAQPRALIEACTRHADRASAEAALRPVVRADDWIAFGLHVDADAAAHWLRALGLTQRFSVVEDPVYSKGLGAYTLCRFADRGAPGRLLYLNPSASGEVYATWLRVP